MIFLLDIILYIILSNLSMVEYLTFLSFSPVIAFNEYLHFNTHNLVNVHFVTGGPVSVLNCEGKNPTKFLLLWYFHPKERDKKQLM